MARLLDSAASQYLEIGQAVVLDVPLTMAAWFNGDIWVNQILLNICDFSAARYFRLELRGATVGDRVRAWHRGATSSQQAITTTGFSADTWHHAAGIFISNTNRRALIDGGSLGTNVVNTGAVSGLDTTNIGCTAEYGSRGSYMLGRVAEAVILNIAATDYQVWLHAQGVPAPIIWPGWAIEGYWSLFETDRDFPVGNYNMVPANAPGWAPHPPKVLEYWRRYQMRAVATQTTRTRIAPWTWVDWSPEGRSPVAAVRVPRYGFTNFQVPGIV